MRTLNEQNQALRGQLAELNTQIDELALNLRMYDRQRLQDIEQNRCNHDIVINQLETMLRGRCTQTTTIFIAREKEYLSLLHL